MFVFVVVGVSRRNQVVHDEGPFTAERRLRPEAQNAILATYRNVKSIIGGLPTAGIEIKPSIARQIELYSRRPFALLLVEVRGYSQGIWLHPASSKGLSPFRVKSGAGGQPRSAG